MRTFLLIILFLRCFSVFSQRTDIQFEHLSMKDGLSMNPVMAIIQDTKGFLWFGTQDGLNKYDGYSFKVFKNDEDDQSTLSDNFITSLLVDKDERIWVGTLSGGISIYDYTTGKFVRINKSNSILNTDKVLSLSLDFENRIWIGTDKGIYIHDGKRLNKAEEIYSKFSKINRSEILCIFHDSKKNIWAGTTEGLFYYEKKMGFHSMIMAGNGEKFLSNDIVLSIFEDNLHEIWIGTLDGLNRNVSPGIFKKYYFKKRESSMDDSVSVAARKKNLYSLVNNYGGNTIRSIFQDNSSNLWLGTDEELIIFNPETENFVNFKKDLINPTGINDHFIRAMYKDKSDILWIGTLGNGINKTDLKKKKFKHYQKKINDPNSLPENYVRCIEEDENGKFWVGTLIGGLSLFDSKTETFIHFKSNGKNDGTTPNDNNVWSLLNEGDGILWIGTNNGLNKFEKNTGEFSYFVNEPDNPNSISENTIRCIFLDSRKQLWVGTEGGLNRWDPIKNSFIKYKEGKLPENLSSNTIWKMVEDENGDLWIATGNGLNKIENGKKEIVKYKNIKGNKFSLSHNAVRTLFIDRKGKLWVGTQHGLNLFDSKKNNFRRFDESDGLPNAFIYSILQDNNGVMWISTNKGVASFTQDKMEFVSYDLYDGLQDYEFNTNAALKSSNGEIYFGGPSGLNRFNPSLLLPSSVNPSIVLTKLKINDKEFIGNVDINEIADLELDYSENNIYFEFAALDYSFPERNRYRYKMEGFDENWVEIGNERMAKYTNLDPGKYTLIIQGTNSDGRWSDIEKRISITITPPFYQTIWFYVFIFFLVTGLVYLFYKYRVMSLKKTNRILEAKVESRTLAIQEEKKKLETLNEQLEKLSIVASKTDNAVIIADENGVIEWINEGFGRMHSFLEDYTDYYGKTIGETSSNIHFQKYLDSAVKNRKSFSYESENVNFEGKRYSVQSTLTPIFDEKGGLRKIVIIDTDITERKRNEEIIREKNKDITDSINYAVRIQQAIFPDESKMKEILQDSFVLFKPKDIVSGDFYFIEPILSNEHHELAGFAVGDCTGHGVPGAFMSIIANNYLKQSLHRKDINNPAQALDFVSENIYLTLSAKSGNQIIRDGMDVAFCVIDYKTNILTYAGANRPLILISDGKMTEIKGDPQAVGYQEVVKPFTLHEINVKKDDIIYLFSDGYADQFGGPEGKKFKYSRFKELLFRIHSLALPEQKMILHEEFENWRLGSKSGNLDKELEQLDDVCVMGVRIK